VNARLLQVIDLRWKARIEFKLSACKKGRPLLQVERDPTPKLDRGDLPGARSERDPAPAGT